jgi:signal transduction histidine kinase
LIGYQIITEQHGGTLSCTSTVVEGTQFSVRLPVTHSATNQVSS